MLCNILLLLFFKEFNIYQFIRYERKEMSELHLIDTQFIAAMGPPGGARNNITPRFLRHFGVLSINPFSMSTLNSIFSSIMIIYFKVLHFFLFLPVQFIFSIISYNNIL